MIAELKVNKYCFICPTGKQNLDDAMDEVARMRFKELVERIREKVKNLL